MNPDPTKTEIIDEDHCIEIGQSTWDAKETSIRNRINKNGKYSRSASSELVLEHLEPIMKSAAKYDLLTPKECRVIIKALKASILRQRR